MLNKTTRRRKQLYARRSEEIEEAEEELEAILRDEFYKRAKFWRGWQFYFKVKLPLHWDNIALQNSRYYTSSRIRRGRKKKISCTCVPSYICDCESVCVFEYYIQRERDLLAVWTCRIDPPWLRRVGLSSLRLCIV